MQTPFSLKRILARQQIISHIKKNLEKLHGLIIKEKTTTVEVNSRKKNNWDH